MVSYFLPGHRFLTRLAEASKRGVTIDLINSARWDIPFMKGALQYLYPWFQRNNINLYEWKPSVLHAKVMIVDREICTIGSYNLNGLSRYNSIEMNINITEKRFVLKLYDEVERIKADSNKVQKIVAFEAGWIKNFINWLNYMLLRVALGMMLLLTKVDRSETP